jgi:hypothetical protein
MSRAADDKKCSLVSLALSVLLGRGCVHRQNLNKAET